MARAALLPLLVVLFVVSGAAGLLYEAVWSRYLSLFVGHDAYAQVITLVIFLGGMGVGALIVSRLSPGIRDPLFAYGIVEALIGVIGLGFHDVLYQPVTRLAYDAIFPALGGGFALGAVKWLLAGLLILPQSILLGATFPLMTAGALRRRPEQPGRTLSILYFSNSLGAAGGVLIAGFWLYAAAGLPGTLAAAAALNLAVALGAILVTKAWPAEVPEEAAGGPAPGEASAPPMALDPATLTRLLLAMAAGTAMASFVYEVGWIRMLSLVLGSSTHAFELMLSAFILGLALGALWVRRRADRFTDPLRTLIIVQLVMGALAMVSLPLYLASFDWTASLVQAVSWTEPGYQLFTLARYALCLVIMLPATFCAGMTLPLITRMLMAAGAGERAIGTVYGVNTLGSIFGAALTGLVLLPAMGLKQTLVFGATIDMLLGLLAAWMLLRAGQPVRRLTMAGAAAMVAGSLLVMTMVPWDQRLLASGVFRTGRVSARPDRRIVFHEDGRTATVHATVFQSSGAKVISTNGKPDGSLTPVWFQECDPDSARRAFSGDDGTQVLLALLLLAHAPEARNGAVIGHGTGMSSHFLLGSPRLERLVTIEIEPAMVRGSRLFYPVNRRVFDDPRSTIAYDDARAYFAATNAKFDLVLSEPSNPWVSGVSGLFTAEFYAQVKRYLAPGAVFGQWLHTYEMNDGLVTGVLAGLHEQFADYRVFLINNGDLLVVASPEGRLRPPDWGVFREPVIEKDLCRFAVFRPAALDRLVVLDRAGAAPLLDRGIRPNSDFYPVLDLGAERARFLRQSAAGITGLGSGIVDFAAPLGPPGADTGWSESALEPAPRVRAFEVAQLLRRELRSPTDSGWTSGTGATDRYLMRVWAGQIAAGRPPASWRGWTTDFWAVFRGLHGGGLPPDSLFFAMATGHAVRHGAPQPVLAAISFAGASARRDAAAAAGAARVLLAEAQAGRHWITADDLLDGAVVSLSLTGRPDEARRAYQVLVPATRRRAGDFRLALLDSHIERARAASRP
ncbi:MAG: fused MFS/spermidine synthase [Gemmatimonadales bacterium]